MRSVIILADLPKVPCRMPVQCSSLYRSLFVVLLWISGQHMEFQSFHLVPVQITVCLNTSTECYCRMSLSQQSGIKENIWAWFCWKDLYENFVIFLVIEFKISPNFVHYMILYDVITQRKSDAKVRNWSQAYCIVGRTPCIFFNRHQYLLGEPTLSNFIEEVWGLKS